MAKTKSTRINLRVTHEAHAALTDYAERHGVTISDVLREGAARLTGLEVIREMPPPGNPDLTTNKKRGR